MVTWSEPSPPSDLVDLGEKGLSEGDDLAPYLDTYWQSGTHIVIPGGEYTCSDRSAPSAGVFAEDSILEGDGMVYVDYDGKSINGSVYADGNAHVLVRNFTYDSVSTAAQDVDAKVRPYAVGSDARVTFENVRRPHGAVSGETEHGGFYVPPEHTGDVFLINCEVQWFTDNGLYASAPGEDRGSDGPVHVWGGLYRNNNICNVRVGSSNSTVREVTAVHDDTANAYVDGAINQRNIWIREGSSSNGHNIEISDCDITTFDGADRSISIAPRHGGGSGEISDCQIEHDTDATPAIHDDSSPIEEWTLTDVTIAGEGDLSSAFEAELYETEDYDGPTTEGQCYGDHACYWDSNETAPTFDASGIADQAAVRFTAGSSGQLDVVQHVSHGDEPVTYAFVAQYDEIEDLERHDADATENGETESTDDLAFLGATMNEKSSLELNPDVDLLSRIGLTAVDLVFDGNPHVFVYVFDGADSVVRIDEKERAADTTSGEHHVQVEEGSTRRVSGLVGEIRFFDRRLMSEERAALTNHLAERWTIDTSSRN